MELGSFFLFLQEQIKDIFISFFYHRHRAGPAEQTHQHEFEQTLRRHDAGRRRMHLGVEVTESSTNKQHHPQQTLRRHDAGRAVDCWPPREE
jgi:hypothetical protein